MRRHRVVGVLVLAMVFAMSSVALGQPIVIDYWGVWGGTTQPIEYEVIEAFNKEYEGRIRVEGSEIAGGPESLLPTAVAGGAPPAVAKLDRFRVGSFASSELIQPIDDLLARDGFSLDEYYPATVEEAIYNGRTYGIPWNTDDRALYYNIRLFEEAGLDPNSPPRTWEEVDEYARALDRFLPDGEIQQVGFVPSWGNWYFPGWLWAAGGDILDADNQRVTWNQEPGVRALRWMQERLQHYGGTQALNAFSGTLDDRGALAGGRLAMQMDGSWNLGNLKNYGVEADFRVAYPPRPAGLEDTPVTWSGGFALVIPAGISGAERDAAWEFIKFYSDHWAQTLLGAGTGQIPALRSAATSPEFLDIDPQIITFVELMQHSRFRPVIPAGDEMWSIYVDEVTSLLNAGEMPAEQILEHTAEMGQRALEEGWERARR